MRRYFKKTDPKAIRRFSLSTDRKLYRIINKKIANQFDFSNIFSNVDPKDVLRTDKNGVIILDSTNPKHADIRARWLNSD